MMKKFLSLFVCQQFSSLDILRSIAFRRKYWGYVCFYVNFFHILYLYSGDIEKTIQKNSSLHR